MFSKDTYQLGTNGATVGSWKSTSFECQPGELLTGFTALEDIGNEWSTLNTVNSPICTNIITGQDRAAGGTDVWAGATNKGTITKLKCPPGSYISAINGSWRGGSVGDKIAVGVGIVCKDLVTGKQTSIQNTPGKQQIYPQTCPSGYFVNKIDFTSGSAVNTVQGTCLNENPRINVLKGTPTTAACCTGQGDPLICGEFTPQSGKCDNYFQNYCAANPTDQVCSCFNVPAGIPPCYATKCLNTGYMTNNMKTSCPSTYVSCDVQLAAQNSGTQLGSGYTLQQNCGQSGGAGTTTVTTPTGTTTTTGGTTITTPSTTQTPSSATTGTNIYSQLFLLFIFIFVVIALIAYYFIFTRRSFTTTL